MIKSEALPRLNFKLRPMGVLSMKRSSNEADFFQVSAQLSLRSLSLKLSALNLLGAARHGGLTGVRLGESDRKSLDARQLLQYRSICFASRFRQKSHFTVLQLLL